jgi:outer membrane protein assembly factor BamD (BamD/ComL family)
MSTKEQVLEELETLSEAEIEEVAEYLAFLKFRSRIKSRVVDESQLAALYAEFADEDRDLAEEGMDDYAEGLTREDAG